MAANSQTLSRLQEITDNQWSIILKQLIIYAELRLDKIGFEPRSELDSVNGEDFAMEGIKKLFDGTRNWNPDNHPDLLIHLKLIVKSLIWNHIKGAGKAVVKLKRNPTIVSGQDPDEAEEGDLVIEQIDNENPLEIIISQERWAQIEAAFDEDSEGFITFCDWLDGIPPRKIAEKYELDVGVVNNSVRRGKRIISKIYAH